MCDLPCLAVRVRVVVILNRPCYLPSLGWCNPPVVPAIATAHRGLMSLRAKHRVIAASSPSGSECWSHFLVSSEDSSGAMELHYENRRWDTFIRGQLGA
jgi:hypothetical protein